MSDEHHCATWKRLSRRVRLNQQICADPFGYHAKIGEVKVAKCVHHIEAVSNAPDKLFDAENLLPLCDKCHAAIHAKTDALSDVAAVVGWVHSAAVIRSGGRLVNPFDKGG